MAWARIRGVIGETRGDLRHGMLCSLIVNLVSAVYCGKSGKAKATQFMPFYEEPKEDPVQAERVKEQIGVLSQVFGTKAN